MRVQAYALVAIAIVAGALAGCGSSTDRKSENAPSRRPPGTSASSQTNSESTTPTAAVRGGASSSSQTTSAQDFEARWLHSISGYTDIETVYVLGNKFRMSTRCLSGPSCNPITEVLNGAKVTVCSGSPRQCHSATEPTSANVRSQNPFTKLPGVAYIRSLYHDLTRVGSGKTLGMPTTCGRGISSIGPPTTAHYCLLDSNHVLATFDAPGEHWKLLSIVGGVSPSHFIVP